MAGGMALQTNGGVKSANHARLRFTYIFDARITCIIDARPLADADDGRSAPDRRPLQPIQRRTARVGLARLGAARVCQVAREHAAVACSHRIGHLVTMHD